MESSKIRAQAEGELSRAIEEALGKPTQPTNPESEHAKLGCTLIAMLPDEAFFGNFPSEAAKDELYQKLLNLKKSHEEIGVKYGLTPIGDGPRMAAGGVLVIYIGYETDYAKSLRG